MFLDGTPVQTVYLKLSEVSKEMQFFFLGVHEEVSYNAGISWSPSGNRFVFMSNGGAGNYDLYLQNSSGSRIFSFRTTCGSWNYQLPGGSDVPGQNSRDGPFRAHCEQGEPSLYAYPLVLSAREAEQGIVTGIQIRSGWAGGGGRFRGVYLVTSSLLSLALSLSLSTSNAPHCLRSGDHAAGGEEQAVRGDHLTAHDRFRRE